MVVNQIKNIINAVTKQAVGETALANVDLTDIVALGDFVLSSDDTKDSWLNTLVDVIGKTITDARKYTPNSREVISNVFEYGALLQKIYVAPMSAVDNETYANSADLTTQYPPTVAQKLFGDKNTFEIPLTISDVQLKSAFKSETDMAIFIDGIFTQLENSMAMRVDGLVDMAYANYIAEKIAYSKTTGAKGVHVINLLTEYNTVSGGALTADDALRDFEFLQFATRAINLWANRMGKMSVKFNTAAYYRHTPKEYLRLTILEDFAASAKVYLRSATYHDNFVELPNYREVAYWQGEGNSYDFADTSKIMITTSSGTTVAQAGIIGLLTDIEAVGVMTDFRRTKSFYNARAEATNYYDKLDTRYYNDMSENGLVFLCADVSSNP